MLNLFKGIFDSDLTNVISMSDFFLCIGTALLIGLIFAGMYMYRTRCSKGFVVTLALLPATVCMVIMMVNGNVGAGVAVAGAFSLVRFRSAPGTGPRWPGTWPPAGRSSPERRPFHSGRTGCAPLHPDDRGSPGTRYPAGCC